MSEQEPKQTADYLDRMTDVDSHEHIPVHMWPEIFGEAGEIGALLNMGRVANGAENSFVRPDITSDDSQITEESVWSVKGPDAPSAIDLTRRPLVLDAMGIERQLVFPAFGLIGLNLCINPISASFFDEPPSVDRQILGRAIIEAHNDWVSEISAKVGDRVRPVAVLLTDSIDQMMDDSESLLARGARAVCIAAGIPPAGTSPGDKALDPFWKLMSDNDIPVTLHVSTEFALFASGAWSANVPEFLPSGKSSIEFPIEPYRGSTMHYCMENYLQAMILAGVFERHPTLRFGCIEACAHWVGPLAERMDLWADQFTSKLASTLSMRPSEYLARNVRVTPFSFEPVDHFLDRYPNLASVYCYSSDFPHVEGGKYSKDVHEARLASFDDELCKQFFQTNGELLLPA